MVALLSFMCVYRQLPRLFHLVSDFANREQCYRDDYRSRPDSYAPPPSVTNTLHLYSQRRPHKLYCNEKNNI